MAECRDPQLPEQLPSVEDATLADMSGAHGLSQSELWDAVGDAQLGALGAWALGEADRLQTEGVSPRDAFLGGVGYAVQALLRQLGRNADKETVARLMATVSVIEDA